jgi:hypothetical protein
MKIIKIAFLFGGICLSVKADGELTLGLPSGEIAGATPAQVIRAKAEASGESLAFVKKLETVPSWTSITKDNLALCGPQLMAVFEQMAKLPPGKVRTVIILYLDDVKTLQMKEPLAQEMAAGFPDFQKKTSIEKEGILGFEAQCTAAFTAASTNMAIFNRYYFAVPERINATEAKSTPLRQVMAWGLNRANGPNQGPADPVSHTVDFIFPLKKSGNGTYIIAGLFHQWSGGPYPALEEFDEFNQKYGTRSKQVGNDK